MLCATDEVGPKLSEVNKPVAAPEPLVRDESLRKTESIREWDKGKKPVHGRQLHNITAVYSPCSEDA